VNEFVASRFIERVTRLALGLEPIDAMQRQPAHPVDIGFDVLPLRRPRPTVVRHASGRHVLVYSPALATPVDVRITDPSARFVPRRLRIPILAPAVAETRPQGQRVRRPVLFPGAAYEVTDATGLRGRVLRGGRPMRWARVQASVAGGRIVARAHGDHRGEFLLLVGPGAGPIGDLEPSLAVDVTVMGPAVAPVPPAPTPLDPLWDLPLEVTAAPGAADPVTAGETVPGDYTATTTQHLDLALGRVLSGVTFTIT
jgi:hypothetical protein